MTYLLLTGSTGLVGRYLLRDLLLADERVAVLVRSNKIDKGADRVESVMSFWEDQLGYHLPRPVVIEGSLTDEGLGITLEDRAWIQQSCDRVLHCAAAMAFRPNKAGEPWRTNVDGTQRLVDFCRETGIRQFHHVSTCYICGLRTGRILETEVDEGQELGNCYEDSKLKAEKLLRSADCFDRVTFYRPASVVGDSKSGYTTSHHGFYLPLQLAYTMSTQVPPAEMGSRFFAKLGLRGDEGTNVVPVDWLSAAIVHLFTHPEHHGKTYQLANPTPASAELIQQVIQDSIAKYSPRKTATSISKSELEAYEGLFQEYMEVYRSHWRDDPVFDVTNTVSALPQLPCPEMDYDTLMRIARYPVENNFSNPRIDPSVGPDCAVKRIEQLPGPTLAPGDASAPGKVVSLQVNGKGGGQWHLSLDRGQIVTAGRGLSPSGSVCVHMNAETFDSLDDTDAVDRGINQGRIVIEGANGTLPEVTSILRRIAK